MARYLAELGSGGSLRDLICERVLDHNGALFNDPREVLEHELEQVATYFADHFQPGRLSALRASSVSSPG